MARLESGKPGGILQAKTSESKFRLTRHEPSVDLNFFVQRFWVVKWDLRGQAPYRQENLPYPCVNLVFERGRSRIYGVVRRKFTRLLEGKGQVFGIKFRPGGFYPFLKLPVSQLTDGAISLREVFALDEQALERAILSLDHEEAMVALAEAFLRRRLPARDKTVELINQIVDAIQAERSIYRVNDLVSRFHLSARTLERIFQRYVGVSPKWVIKQCRLQEAAEQLANNPIIDWPQLAVALGYFDQAHFIHDFKTIVGQTPAAYARSLG
jgi:AraC-like DNA-binding protein